MLVKLWNSAHRGIELTNRALADSCLSKENDGEFLSEVEAWRKEVQSGKAGIKIEAVQDSHRRT